MKWLWNGSLSACQISGQLLATVTPSSKHGPWLAAVGTIDEGAVLWAEGGWGDEASAKAAVCYWIGKTMAQFSNALAEGCQQVDEE